MEKTKLNEFHKKIKRIKELNDNILKLANDLENQTIDKLVSMDEVELAFKTLSGVIPSLLETSKK